MTTHAHTEQISPATYTPHPAMTLRLSSGPAKSPVAPRATTRDTAQALLPIEAIDIARQVRREVDGLESLAESIRSHGGLLQPVVVTEAGAQRWRLVAGERRLRAAQLAGLTHVAASVRPALPEVEVRRMQIAENLEREDLTPFEEALGVTQDVERFGRAEARRLWNRAEGWISKRLAAGRYAPQTLSILQDGLTGDFEILHALNQIERADAGRIAPLRARLEAGEALGREEVRAIAAAGKSAAGRTRLRRAASAVSAQDLAAVDDDPAPRVWPFARMTPASGGAALAEAAPGAGGPPAAAAPGAARTRAASLSELDAHRRGLFLAGAATGERVSAIARQLAEQAGNGTAREHEWVLWSAFMDAALPALAALGEERAATFARRLAAALERQPAARCWRELHPVAAGADEDEADAPRREIAPMPAGWRG